VAGRLGEAPEAHVHCCEVSKGVRLRGLVAGPPHLGEALFELHDGPLKVLVSAAQAGEQ
jgi:hypothetical protein